jgi:diguanylate cyclase (GGDEF)-like protein
MAEAAPISTQISREPDTESDSRHRLLHAIGIDLAALPANARAAVEAMASEVIAVRADRSELQQKLEAAELLADRDALCPVFNRRAFERELSREIALAERYGTPLSLIFIDLDRFKLINDRFGHATGDKVIQHVAQTLIDNVRQTDIVGRLGGDEFGIALTHAEHQDSAAKAASLEQMIGSLTVRDSAEDGLDSVKLGASCGCVEWQRGYSSESLIALADETMFRAKNAKKRAR